MGRKGWTPAGRYRTIAGVTYAERADAAQQEQLDWLHQIHEQELRQTAILERIAQHTSLLYGWAIVSFVLLGLGVLVWLASLSGR